MKKIVLFVSSLLILCSLVSAKETKKRHFFEKRYVELQTNISMDFSNNVLSLDEIMVKNFVIDLRKIADSMSKDGMVVTAGFNPYLALNTNFGNLQIGVSAGLDVYEKMTVSKDLFDFLGYGNSLGKTLNVGINDYLDVFVYSDLKVGYDFGKFSVYAKPAVFSPIISTGGKVGTASFQNDESGNIVAKVNVSTDVYTPIDFDYKNSQFKYNGISYIYGADLAGGFAIPVGKFLVVSGDGRIPIIPAHFTKKSRLSMDMTYKTSTQSLGKDSDNSEPVKSFENNISADYWLNRPFKFNAYVDFYPLGYLFDIRAGAGFGIHNPFFEGAYSYPEYYLGAKVNLFYILKVGLSTEYTSEVFKHQMDLAFNLRLFEIDAGVSLQSANFTKSLQGAGVGGFVVLSFGF